MRVGGLCCDCPGTAGSGYWRGDEQYDRTITSKVTAPPPATALFIIMFTNTAAATETLKKVQFSGGGPGLAAWLI